MALTYSPLVAIAGDATPILEEVFFDNKTVSQGYVTFNDKIKAGTIFTEEGITVTAQAYTGAALSSSGSLTITDRTITPVKLEYKQTFLYDQLRTSRFNRDMKPGAWNIESNEFATAVLSKYGPKVSEDAQKIFWGGVTSTTKTAIAGLTPGAGQGSMSAATQTAFAALTAGFVDGVFTKVAYDNSAVGTYIKVAGTTITAANIAAECAKIYAVIPPEYLQDDSRAPKIYCPFIWKQYARTANNAVGAAQQINFLFDGPGNDARCFYNGIEMLFVPVPNNNWAYCQRPEAVSWNTDMTDDVNKVDIGKTLNDGDTMYLRTIYTLAANVGAAAKGIFYGG